MKEKKDKIKEARKRAKEGAILFAKKWAEEGVEGYAEPTRLGTAKGDPIGLSGKKYFTALLMVLHPNLTLKEIAEIAGVSEGVIRVWRTEKKFKKAVAESCASFGNGIGNWIEKGIYDREIQVIKTAQGKSTPYGQTIFKVKTRELQQNPGAVDDLIREHGTPVGMISGPVLKILKSANDEFTVKGIKDAHKITKVIELDDTQDQDAKDLDKYMDGVNHLLDFLPFYNPNVGVALFESIKRNIGHTLMYRYVHEHLVRVLTVSNEKAALEWQRQSPVLEMTMNLINEGIDILSDPQDRKELGAEERTECAEQLRALVSQLRELIPTT